jgi:hypothetical protein
MHRQCGLPILEQRRGEFNRVLVSQNCSAAGINEALVDNIKGVPKLVAINQLQLLLCKA